MINHNKKWYHYGMLPFAGIFGIVAGCFMLVMFQILIYDGIEEDVVTFAEQCEVTIGPEDEHGDVVATVAMTCGDETVKMSELAVPYLYKVLTTERAPVMFCTKTVSEYLGNVNWSCEIDPEEKEV